MADSLIEARSMTMVIPMFLAMGGVWVWLWRRSYFNIHDDLIDSYTLANQEGS